MKFTSLLSAAFVTLSLGVGYISAQFLLPPPLVTQGFYQFVSAVTDVDGNRLALTDQGVVSLPVLLTVFGAGQANQVWNVTGSNIFTVTAPSSPPGSFNPIQVIVNSSGGLVTAVNGGTMWSPSQTASGFTFSDVHNNNWAIPPTTQLPTNGTAALATSISFSSNLFPFNSWVPVRVS